jgi:thiol-disulfide isomerase/thioredoxin
MMIKYFVVFIKLISFCAFLSAQTISGNLGAIASQEIRLVGFDGFKTYFISKTTTNERGSFQLSFSKIDYGVGYIISADEKPFYVILSGDDIEIQGDSLNNTATLRILISQENMWFEQYAKEHPRREQALSAWDYLEKIYTLDSLFAVQQVPSKAIFQEKQRIKAEDSLFMASLDPHTFVSWYLPLRKLVSNVSTIAQYRTEEIPASITAFRYINYSDPRLYKSGLLSDVIESHFWLIENSGRSLDSVYYEMQISIDRMIENLLADEKKLNEITEYLFKLLEKRSLFGASEYLAIKLLNEKSCTINNDFVAQLESYRAMKKGNIAPDFEFKNDIFAPGYEAAKLPKKLSDLESKYLVVVFGASWCPQCPEELLQIARLYDKWKKFSIKVVFVSLDEDEKIFMNFTEVFPFISLCDYEKWGSSVVKSYHVFATPTIYLLDNKREILLRPNSVSQLDSWVDWYLVEGNSY